MIPMARKGLLLTCTDTESRYSNIERECLAVIFGLEKFEYYLLGRHTLVKTDHLPLEQIFKENIAEAPARLQRLMLRCMKPDTDDAKQFLLPMRYHVFTTVKVPELDSREKTVLPSTVYTS